jgi:hypothetical protein
MILLLAVLTIPALVVNPAKAGLYQPRWSGTIRELSVFVRNQAGKIPYYTSPVNGFFRSRLSFTRRPGSS